MSHIFTLSTERLRKIRFLAIIHKNKPNPNKPTKNSHDLDGCIIADRIYFFCSMALCFWNGFRLWWSYLFWSTGKSAERFQRYEDGYSHATEKDPLQEVIGVRHSPEKALSFVSTQWRRISVEGFSKSTKVFNKHTNYFLKYFYLAYVFQISFKVIDSFGVVLRVSIFINYKPYMAILTRGTRNLCSGIITSTSNMIIPCTSIRIFVKGSLRGMYKLLVFVYSLFIIAEVRGECEKVNGSIDEWESRNLTFCTHLYTSYNRE